MRLSLLLLVVISSSAARSQPLESVFKSASAVLRGTVSDVTASSDGRTGWATIGEAVVIDGTDAPEGGQAVVIEHVPHSLCHGGASFVRGEEVVVAIVRKGDGWSVWEPTSRVDVGAAGGAFPVTQFAREIRELRSGTRTRFAEALRAAVLSRAGVRGVAAGHPFYGGVTSGVTGNYGDVGAGARAVTNAAGDGLNGTNCRLSGTRKFCGGRPVEAPPLEIIINRSGAVGRSGNPLSFAEIKAVAVDAAKAWDDVVHSRPVFTVSNNETTSTTAPVGKVILSFDTRIVNGYAQASPTDGTSPVRSGAVTLSSIPEWNAAFMYPLDGYTYSNPYRNGPNIQIASQTCPEIGLIDMRDVLTHELSHILGFGHPEEAGADLTTDGTDYTKCGGGGQQGWWTSTKRRDLQEGDILGKIFVAPQLTRSASGGTVTSLQ